MSGPRAQRRGGFSLIEVLIAMVILTIGAASLLALYAAAAATHKRSVDRTHAAMLAEEVIAQVQGRYLPGMEIEELAAALRGDPLASPGSYQWKVYLGRPGEEGGVLKLAAPLEEVKAQKSAKAAQPKTGAKRKPAALPRARAAAAQADDPDWEDDEVLVRVVIGWSQSGRTLTESFDSLVLPRPVTYPSRKR